MLVVSLVLLSRCERDGVENRSIPGRKVIDVYITTWTLSSQITQRLPPPSRGIESVRVLSELIGDQLPEIKPPNSVTVTDGTLLSSRHRHRRRRFHNSSEQVDWRVGNRVLIMGYQQASPTVRS